MANSDQFSTGFLRMTSKKQDMFLSVTPGFEHGPGIIRDGLTIPRMTDPHSVYYVCNDRGIDRAEGLSHTTDGLVQRSGTWTLYHHLKEFVEQKGDEWLVVGMQSNGDLTMNPWHVAYLGDTHINNQKAGTLCGLLLQSENPDDLEKVESRSYRCIVKWKPKIAELKNANGQHRYEAHTLQFHGIANDYHITFTNKDVKKAHDALFKKHNVANYDRKSHNIAPLIDFALSGKPIVENSVELPLSSSIDKFQDIRHIFNLPEVEGSGAYKGQIVKKVILGEAQLFRNKNERRAALSSAIIVDLNAGGNIVVDWEKLHDKLTTDLHFKISNESPARRGQFRKYPGGSGAEEIEIFFPPNVYPFGVFGIHDDVLVGLSSGGLSGRVGNTLEGITRIMYDYFGCSDALVLDEGLDTFQIVNPDPNKDEDYSFSNEQLLKKTLSFTKQMVDAEHEKSLVTDDYHTKGGMKSWPLNEHLKKIDRDFKKLTGNPIDFDDVLAVRPHRSQIRSVIIYAVEKSKIAKANRRSTAKAKTTRKPRTVKKTRTPKTKK